MASTNKTTNYNLSQFLGSDKPAWLTDYNQDMSKIDTGINAAQNMATAADGKADANTTNIGDLSYLSTTAKNTLVAAINEVDSTSETAQNTANTAAASAAQASSGVNDLADYLSLNTNTSVSASSNKGTVTSSSGSISVAKNNTNSLAKIYGSVNITNLSNSSGTLTLTIGDTGLRPSSAITFNGCAYVRVEDTTSHIFRQLLQSYTLNTDGTITITRNLTGLNAYTLNFTFIACLLFITDFGDIPEDN